VLHDQAVQRTERGVEADDSALRHRHADRQAELLRPGEAIGRGEGRRAAPQRAAVPGALARIEIARPSMRLTQAAVGAEEAPDLLPRRAFAGDDALHDRIARWNMELDPLRRRRGLEAAGIEHASIGEADEGC